MQNYIIFSNNKINKLMGFLEKRLCVALHIVKKIEGCVME